MSPQEQAAAITRGWRSIEIEIDSGLPISRQRYRTIHVGGDMVAGVTQAITAAIAAAVKAERERILGFVEDYYEIPAWSVEKALESQQ